MNRLAQTVAASKQITITPPSRFFDLRLDEMWRHRELVYYFIWRDVKVRYKQTILGVLWTLIRPLVSMGIFTFVFSTLGGFPSHGVPYPLLALSGVVVWTIVAEGVSGATQSLLSNPNLITKVYFPRLVLPVAAVLRTLVDIAVTLLLCLVFMLVYKQPIAGTTALLLPLSIGSAMLAALGFGLWFSAVSVRYRDIALAMPFILQLLFWISPVGYSSAMVPQNLQLVYWLNPLVGVIESFRFTLLGTAHVPTGLMVLSFAMNGLLCTSGLWYFLRSENDFADVI